MSERHGKLALTLRRSPGGWTYLERRDHRRERRSVRLALRQRKEANRG